MNIRRTQVPALCFRAAVATVNEHARTVDVIWSTGAAVERRDQVGARFLETLSLDPKHVRLERLNAGAPLLNSHAAFSIFDVVGVVERASVDGARGLATVRFSQRSDVDGLWRDVVDGIVRALSVGYRVHRYQETPGTGGGVPTRCAVDWTPYELSFVAMPADTGATVRSGFAPPGDDEADVIYVDNSPAADADRLARLARARAFAEELDRRYGPLSLDQEIVK